MLWRQPTLTPWVRPAASTHLPVLAMVATEVAASFVVGRIDEVRLLFPVAFAVAWVGIDLWQGVVASFESEETPVA
jgi:hypothetical protein